MAKFEEQITTKEMESKVHIKAETEKKKKAITPEEKRKYIAYAVIGLFALGFVFYAVNDFSGDDKKTVQELETPESEADKYNTKLQAIENGDKPVTTTSNLEDAYKTSATDQENEKNDEAAKKLEAQLKALENDEKQQPEQRETPRQKSTSSSTSNYQRNSGSQRASSNQYVNTEPRTVRDEPREETKPSSSGSGFFKNKGSSSSSSSSVSNVLLYASIHTDQIIKDGSRVKMRLTKGVNINGNSFPINTIIYGIAKIQQNRLMVEINKINQTDVKLEIFDAEDSNPGIYVETPNLNSMIRKEFKKDALDEKDLEKIPFSKTLKNLFAKKAKEENIELLNNYKIIIKEKHED